VSIRARERRKERKVRGAMNNWIFLSSANASFRGKQK
jgi:hypothetical protein